MHYTCEVKSGNTLGGFQEFLGELIPLTDVRVVRVCILCTLLWYS